MKTLNDFQPQALNKLNLSTKATINSLIQQYNKNYTLEIV